jgi:hypothetical protein
MNTGFKTKRRDHVNDVVEDEREIRIGSALMKVPDQIAQLCQALPSDKQVEVLDFVEVLISRQSRATWTVEKRREIVAKTLGCLHHTRTSSEVFARRKQDEKAKEERRRKA